jgi:hypothetical protein
MGCLFVIVAGGVSAAMLFFFGYDDWVLIVLGLLWLASLAISVLNGHQGFGGRGNTDAQIVIAGLFIAAAITLPNYVNKKHCDQAKTALAELAGAEEKYRAEHKTYTAVLSLLNLSSNPNIQLEVNKADEKSFAASSSHGLCNKEKGGTPEIFIWDSSRKGLQ